jgi:protein-L-isoaspartate(D-aspartate) O-methyltransferase
MEDSYLHKGLRAKLVDEIRKKGIIDEIVLNAISKIPRHIFMDSSFVQFSYKDMAFPIGAGQTISQPYTVAFQTELLQIKKHEKVLEIGTGSGYQTAVLIELGAKVFTIERQKELYLKAKEMLTRMSYKPQIFYGDGYEGLPSYGPFDKIIVTAGADEIPPKLIEQLKAGGRMVIPVGDTDVQAMKLIIKKPDQSVEIYTHGMFAFVPLLKGKVENNGKTK